MVNISETEFEKKVLVYLQKRFPNQKVSEHPLGKLNVDIGVFKKDSPNDIEIFVEVKGTVKSSDPAKIFDNIQNHHHLAVGIFQLMRRIQHDWQKGELYLPDHPSFEKRLKEAKLTLKNSKLRVFLYKESGEFEEFKF